MKRIILIFIFLVAAWPASVRAAQEPPALTGRARQVVAEAQDLLAKEMAIEAAARIEAFLAKRPERNHYLLAFTFANALATGGDAPGALLRYRESVALYAGYGPAWLNLGKTAYDLGEYGEAAAALVRGYETSGEPDPRNLYYGAVAYVMDGREESALPLLERLVSGELGEPAAEWIKALLMTCMDMGLRDKAGAALGQAIDIAGHDPLTWKLACQFHVDGEAYGAAAAAMTVCSYLVPLDRDERVLLGDLYSAAGVPLGAAGHYRTALFSDGNEPEPFERLAAAYIEAHRTGEAVTVLRRSLEAVPSARLASWLGDILFEAEDFGGAYEAFARSTALDAGDGRAWIMMAHCAISMDEPSNAADALDEAGRFPAQAEQTRELKAYLSRIALQDSQ